MSYDHHFVEKKWQKIWKEKKTFKASIDYKKPKFYVLDMFPYPSGAGLHVGHVTGYTGTDIMARYKRQCGFNVLHPMGWDSFGLPAEQYAIRTGTHPAIVTRKNIETYHRQLESLGFSYDWEREITTSDPAYYKWTQWIFTLLYNKGLAYEAEVSVNFCPELGTVLANEEVEGGKSILGGYPVIKKPLRQWILKITKYADRLIEDLELANWPENIKKLQINWIGRSEGAKIDFCEEKTKEKIQVFTTRPDTLFGVSYLLLSPEHPLVRKITSQEQKQSVEHYVKACMQMSEFERAEAGKEKTGVWTGSYAIHPLTDKKIPIWISDYVLMGYGTGTVMGVPGNDERDFAFAKTFHLPIIPVYDPDMSLCEDLQYLSKEEYRNCVLSSQRCWTLDGKAINSSNEKVSINGCSIEKAKEILMEWIEKNHIGERAVSYKLRDWLFSRQRYWGEPFPILHFEDGSYRILDLDELPLMPPELEDYKPAGTGESPLTKVKEWVEITDPKTKKRAKRETNTMPQWAGSCWYYLRFCDPNNDQEAWSLDAEKYWMNVDLYVGGAEHAVAHLLYARFWHKVLYDCGLVSTKEPFGTYQPIGVVTAPSYKKANGEYVASEEIIEKEGSYFHKITKEKLTMQIDKMSKSKLNGVTPDDMIEEFGADSLRLYEMFMGPFDKEKVWNTDAVSGCKRFLHRFWELAHSDKLSEESTEEALCLGHRLVHLVVKDIEQLSFNTAIAKMMEFVNSFSKLSVYSKPVLKMATQVLYPFAPHLAAEVWEKLGEKKAIDFVPLPVVIDQYLIDKTATFVIQVNGKVRARMELEKNQTQDSLLALAKEHEQVRKYLERGRILKTVFVPEKLLNIVVEDTQ
jgi:leucyl-tRNA synthetase